MAPLHGAQHEWSSTLRGAEAAGVAVVRDDAPTTESAHNRRTGARGNTAGGRDRREKRASILSTNLELNLFVLYV